MAPFCRLFTPSTNLVLDACSAEVFIVDVHASVTLSQRFTNPSGLTLGATYAFGLLSGVAVCGFEMIRKDGTRIEGIARSKEDAIQEFRQVLAEGKTASLGQEQTHDVFSISVGNIGAHETVTINLRFVQALADDEDNDQVKFIFPCVYAQRYGIVPSSTASSATSIVQPFRMNVTVQQSGPIKSVSCPSGHPINFAVPSRNGTLAKVSLKHDNFLAQDVILVISAENLDSPRCFIETHPSSDHSTMAMALTFVPRFEIPDVSSGMEYIFMIDRSGSMAGSNIRLVKDALIVLLRSLPTKGTIFNLVSFGTRTTMLWPQSRDYSQFSVDLATQYVDDMEANYGGTEITSALQTVFSSLRKPLDRPAAVFLLTDGGFWGVSDCVSAVTAAVHQSNDAEKSFLRVFTMGIGAGASTDMCDSIARAGGGTAVYVQEGEEMVGKCARLVRAARTPPIHIEVEWIDSENGSHFTKEVLETDGKTEDFDTKDDNDDANSNADTVIEDPVSLPISLFQSTAVDLMRGTGPPEEPIHPPPPTIQQAPHTMSRLYPGTRTQMYAILNVKGGGSSSATPRFIKVQGTVGMTGLPVELQVPVTKLISPLSAPPSLPSGISTLLSSSRIQSKAQAQAPILPFLHVLAAKALITELRDGKHQFSNSISEPDEFKRKLFCKKEIIRLGTTYGLTSEHTSFIAVDHSRRVFSVSRQINGAKTYTAPLKVSHMISSNASPMNREGKTPSAYNYLRSPTHPRTPVSFVDSYDPTIEDHDPTMYGQEEYSTSRVHSVVEPPNPVNKNPSALFHFRPLASSRLRPQSLSISSRLTRAPTSLFRRMSLSLSTKAQNSLSSKDTPVTSLPISSSTAQVVSQSASTTVETPLATSSTKASTTSMTPGERLAAVARLQRYDGGFVWSRLLFDILGLNLADPNVFKSQLNVEGIEENTAATILAWMWLEINGGDDGFDMARKAGEWLGASAKV